MPKDRLLEKHEELKQKKKRMKKRRQAHRNILMEKWKEALTSVTPITVIVLVLCFLLVPVPTDAMWPFLTALRCW